jgi:hypothetical protein
VKSTSQSSSMPETVPIFPRYRGLYAMRDAE